jgi:methyl-accepting chemotaxis protein
LTAPGPLPSTDDRILAHPDESKILTLNLREFDFGKAILDQSNGTFRYHFEELDKIASFRRCGELGWIIEVAAGPTSCRERQTRSSARRSN